jgi:hypothetical protein
MEVDYFTSTANQSEARVRHKQSVTVTVTVTVTGHMRFFATCSKASPIAWTWGHNHIVEAIAALYQ